MSPSKFSLCSTFNIGGDFNLHPNQFFVLKRALPSFEIRKNAKKAREIMISRVLVVYFFLSSLYAKIVLDINQCKLEN